MRYPWIIETQSCGEDQQRWVFPNQADAKRFCAVWLPDHPNAVLRLSLRKNMRPTRTFRLVNGKVMAEKPPESVRRRTPSPRARKSLAEEIDRHLANLGLTTREAARARLVLVKIWKEGLHKDGFVWTPAGAVLITKSFAQPSPLGQDFDLQTLWPKSTIKLVFKPNLKIFSLSAGRNPK